MADISLDTTQNADGVLSLMKPQGPSYTPEHTDDLTDKIGIAMGNVSPGPVSIKSAITNNHQDDLARILQSQKDLQYAGIRNGIVQDIANKTGGVPSSVDLDVIRSLGNEQITSSDLGSILEQEYSKRVTNGQLDVVNDKTGSYDQSIATNPQMTNEVLDRAEWATSRNMISKNLYAGLQQQFSDTNIVQKGLAWAQTVVPFRSWYAMNSFLDKDKPQFINDILPGDTIRDTVSYLHSLPPDQYKTQLTAATKRLTDQGDYLDAMQMVEATMSYGDDDKNWQNVFAGLDVASVVPIGSLTKALKGSSQAVNVIVRDSEALSKVAGLGADSAKAATTRALQKGTLPSLDIATKTDIERNLVSIQRPSEFFVGKSTKADAAVIGRLTNSAMMRDSKALELLTDINKVQRLSDADLPNAVNSLEEQMRKSYTDQNHQIINFTTNLPDNTTNVHSVTMTLGKKNGDLFPSKLAAQGFAGRFIKLKTNDYNIVDKGTGWSIEITRDIDETKAGIRDFKVDTDSKNADNFGTRFFSTFMGADTKLSPSQTRARGVAVMSTERSNELLEEFGKPFAALQKNKVASKEFDGFLKANRDRVDPARGKGPLTYHTVSEFEDAWHQQYNKAPTYEQIDAYTSMKQAYDLDTNVRALDVYKQKSILGLENFSTEINKSFVDRQSDALKVYQGDPLAFEGKEIDNLPRGQGNWVAAAVDVNGTLHRGNRLFSNYMDDKAWAKVQKMLDEGYKILQPSEGSVDIDGNHYNFILAKNFKRDQIKMNLSFSNGLRELQKYPYFVKQARLNIKDGTARYLGDVALANARDADEAKFISDVMERARQKIIGSEGDAKKFFEDNLPMWDYEDFMNSAKEGKIDLRIPFSVTKSGARTVDTEDVIAKLQKEGLDVRNFEKQDEWRLANSIRGKFLGSNDEQSMAAWGVENNKIFELGTDSQLSPLDTLRISMGNMVDVNVMNDYKIKSVRDFTQQFGHLLDGNVNDYNTNGLKYIYDAHYRPGADPNQIRSAEAVRKAILGLWQHQTVVDRQIGLYKEKIVRSLRGKLGDNVAEWANDKALPSIQHADRYMRGFAFHTKMGFFNIKQLFLQTTSAVNIVALSPKYGAKASMLTMPIMAGLYAPEKALKGIGSRLAGTIGMKPEEYVDLIKAYKRSGFNIVGGDVAYLDDLSPPNLVKGKVGQILDAGTSFFKTGERISRSMAFAAAYMERKVGKDTLTRADEAWILQRAKDMTGNMTRDSNAPFQQGFAAVATQFMGYQARLMEQMLGSKLTGPEKARLFAFTGLVYGVPAAMGMTLGVVPVRTWLTDWMTSQNVQYNNTLAEPFIDGFASQILKNMTGTDFNVAEKYGPGGISTFYDFLKGNSEFTDLLLGASGGVILSTMKDADPIIKYYFSSIDHNDVTTFPLQTQDFLNIAREISSVNQVVKLSDAVNLGVWMSKNENVMTNVTPLEGYISAVLGLDPERVSTAFSQIGAMSQISDAKKAAKKEMISDYRRGIQALRSQDTTLATSFFNRVKTRGIMAGLNDNEMVQMYIQANNEEPLDESVLKQYAQMGGQQ